MSNCLDQLRIIIKEKILFLTFFFLVVGCDGDFKAISSKVIIKFPKVVDIKLDSDKKLYGLGSSIGILIRFSHPVIVKSDGEKTPSITLSFIGLSRNAQYISGTGTKTLLFQYIVAVNDENSDLVEMGSTINLNGTSISSSSGNNAILDLKPIKIGGIDAIIPLSPSGLSLHDPLTSPSNDSTPEITVSGVEPFAKVEIFSDSSCNTNVSSSTLVLENQSTVNIITTTITSEGTVTYYARQTDQAGNESLCSSASLSYEYDETRPARPSGLSLHDPSTSPGHDSTPAIIVAGVEPLAKVDLFSDSSCNTSVSSSALVLENKSTVNIITTTITSDGTVTYYARQTDQAGNESLCSSASLSYEYDGTRPARPSGLSLHDPLTSPNNDPTPEIIVSGVEPLAKVEIFKDNSCNTSVSSPESVQQNESTANIIANIITSDSTVTYYARQTDQAGNESPCSSSSLSYEYGEAIPNPPSDLSLHDPLTSPSNDSTPEITVSGVEPLAQVQLFSDSSCNTSVSSSVSALENESTVNIIANTITSDGTVTYYTRQTNQAGDESPCSIASLSYEYDGTQPVAPSSLSLHDPLTSPSTDPTPEIIVSGVEPLATVELFSGFLCYSSADSQESVPPNKSTVHIIANTITSDSTVTYSARQTDQAGNESPCSSYGATLSYEYDGTQPEPPSSLSLHDPSRSPSNDSTPEILVSGVEPLAKVELFRDNSCNTSVSSQESVPPNKFTVQIIANTIPSNGTITYYAQQTDRVGYVSLCSSASTSYEYDEMIPNPPSDLSLHDPLTSPSDDSTPEIIVSGVDPLATVELFSDSSCSTSVSSQESVQQNESTVHIIANTITSDSAVTYYARQTDQEGHASLCSSVSLFYEYDGTQPAPPSSLSLHDPSRSPSNDSTPEILVSGVEPLAKVELFSDSSCSTSVSSQESVQQNESTVQIIANTIPSNGTVTYYVRQTDRAGHASLCSGASLSYKYDEMIPNPAFRLKLT